MTEAITPAPGTPDNPITRRDMNPYYECHITILGDPKIVKLGVELIGWKFSSIAGDPVLGDEVYCYATKHYKTNKTPAEVIKEMNIAANQLSEKYKMYIRRQKVEIIIFDKREII